MTAPWTWHGGGLRTARAHFGDRAEPWLDLSTGINPHPWPGAGAIAVDWQRLPEREALTELECAAAAHFGVATDHVCAVPGTELAMRLVARSLGRPIKAMAPCYRTHADIAVDTVERGASVAGSLLLANPNNPDGHYHDRATLTGLLDDRGCTDWLLIDEAFADCRPAFSLADQVDDDRRLLIFRSFGKFFGLAGVRLGFVLGPRAALVRLREALGAWPVSAAAIAFGTSAYKDRSWIETTRTHLERDVARLDTLLRSAGFATIGACPLFRLIETAEAAALFNRLAHAAILTRPFSEHPDWLRIGLPADEEAFARLERALRNG